MSRLFHADSQRAAPAPRQHTEDPLAGRSRSQWEMRLRPVVGCRYLDGNASCSAQGYLSIKGLGSPPAPWAWGLPALCAGCSSSSPMGGQSRGLGCKARAPLARTGQPPWLHASARHRIAVVVFISSCLIFTTVSEVLIIQPFGRGERTTASPQPPTKRHAAFL